MNIEFSKIKSPFNPKHDHMSDLAMRIQRKVGIDPQELFEKPELKEPVLPRNPIQLSVEFGNSYVAQAPENTYIETAEVEVEEEVSQSEIAETSEIDNIETDSNVTVGEVADTQTDEVSAESQDIPALNKAAITSTVLEPSPEEIEAEKLRSAEVERKRAEAAARYAALLDESRSDYVPINKSVQEDKPKGLPWTSILGVAASIGAIATAWWVWNLIQAPASVEQIAEISRQTTVVSTIETPAPANTVEATVAFEELSEESQLVADLVLEEDEINGLTPNKDFPHFTQMDEQSKVSMVEMENNGLLIMELEDDIFDDQWL